MTSPVSHITADGYPVVQGGRRGNSAFAGFDSCREVGVYMKTLVPDAAGREICARIKRGEF